MKQDWRPEKWPMEPGTPCDFCDEVICRCAGEEIVEHNEVIEATIGKGCTCDMVDESCGQCE